MKKWFLLILCAAVTSFGQTKIEDIQQFTLENGMKVFVLEDHSIPNANMYFFFKVGSRNEYPGITGLSHFFEHMMFNGAEKYGPKEFDRVMEAHGGSNNAYTTENITAYTDWFPTSSMEKMFELEADRIHHLAIDPKMVESERGVVLSERITGLENSSYRLLHEQLKAVAFHAHPYKWSVIGYESDIKNWTGEDLKKYFDTYYAPNNCVVVISGDVRFDDVKRLSEKYFGPIPRRSDPKPVHVVEPDQLGEKRLSVHKAVSSPHVMIAWHVPETASEDFYAMDILNSALSEGRSSRLIRSLVDEKQLALRIFTSYPKSLDPNLFYIYGICAPGVDESTLESAIYEILNGIGKDGITDTELQKIKNRKLAAFYHSMETINSRSNNIGTYELYFGNYKKLFTAPEDYEKVSSDDIKHMVNTYFKGRNRTVGILKNLDEVVQ